MKYYKITWKDYFSAPEWKDKEALSKWVKKEDEGEHCTTVGVISYEDKDVVVVSASFDGQESYGDSIAIYKSCIVKKKPLDI
jgi:hypothetical protein|tara:strand:+ start:465 stop:710 length:246 start_codon:yes stop_codon:yes gene_type:complete